MKNDTLTFPKPNFNENSATNKVDSEKGSKNVSSNEETKINAAEINATEINDAKNHEVENLTAENTDVNNTCDESITSETFVTTDELKGDTAETPVVKEPAALEISEGFEEISSLEETIQLEVIKADLLTEEEILKKKALKEKVLKNPKVNKFSSFIKTITNFKNKAFDGFEKATLKLPGVLGKTAQWGWARRGGARLIFVTAIAAGLTWHIAVMFGMQTPVTAAIAATLTIQAAVHTSLNVGFSRIGATIVGLILAVACISILGITALSITVVVFVTLIAGRFMGLGAEGSQMVPATSLGVFVAGVGLDSDILSERVIATIFGVVMGVILSSFAHRETANEKATNEVEKVNNDLSNLLADLAKGVSEGINAEKAKLWLESSRLLNVDFNKAKEYTQEALIAARWGTNKTKKEALNLVKQTKSLAHSCEQVNSIARAFFDLTQKNKSELFPTGLSEVLEKASEAFAVNADNFNDDASTTISNSIVSDAINEIKEERVKAVNIVKDINDTGVWLLSGSVLNDVDRMIESLDKSAPALNVNEADEDKYQIKPSVKVNIKRIKSAQRLKELNKKHPVKSPQKPPL